MKINVKKASLRFFASTSFELIYKEAVANALDAEANDIQIEISLGGFTDTESLEVIIRDNGVGFTDERFKKFSTLLEVDDDEHKGIGRLVYLSYFDKVDISSYYEGKRRVFVFDSKFEGKSVVSVDASGCCGTQLRFSQFNNDKVKKYDFLTPSSIERSLYLHFLPRFYMMKETGKQLKITINLTTNDNNVDRGFQTSTTIFTLDNLPSFSVFDIGVTSIDLTSPMSIHYSIIPRDNVNSAISAVWVDDRTIILDVLSKDRIPIGYDAVFILRSDYFKGMGDDERVSLKLEAYVVNEIKSIFRDGINKILDEMIPVIKNSNEQTIKNLEEKYPHLGGYFRRETAGLIDRSQTLDIAQLEFIREQKSVLDADDVDHEMYEKSSKVAARVLANYILYRNKILNILDSIDHTNSEADIHKLIVPPKSIVRENEVMEHLYKNNAWILDDKFMSFSTVLSDKEMSKLIECITNDESEYDDTRPDIAFVFSGDPCGSAKVDVVIVELKKMGVKDSERELVVGQLRKRARKLLSYYPDVIQRIWFYGIVDFTEELISYLREDGYSELFSKDTCYYKEQPIIPAHDKSIKIPAGMFILSYKALIQDAKLRNSTFLNILKHTIKEVNQNS